MVCQYFKKHIKIKIQNYSNTLVVPPGCFMLERRIYFMLEWYVLIVRKNQIDKYNALAGFDDDIKKARKKMKSRNDLKEWLNREFMHYFWCKSEHEMLVGDCWIKNLDSLLKVDVYYQLQMNLDNITDYVIYKMNFKFGRNK